MMTFNLLNNLVHDVGPNSVHSDRIVSVFQQIEEHVRSGLEKNTVAVELLLSTLDSYVSVFPGAEAGQRSQQTRPLVLYRVLKLTRTHGH